MDFNSIYLSQKEKRRFLAIATGDTTASNTPDEDILIRYGLVTETMLVKIDLATHQSSTDPRAVILSDLGNEYYAQYRHHKKKDQQESYRFWLGFAIALIGVFSSHFGI